MFGSGSPVGLWWVGSWVGLGTVDAVVVVVADGDEEVGDAVGDGEAVGLGEEVGDGEAVGLGDEVGEGEDVGDGDGDGDEVWRTMPMSRSR